MTPRLARPAVALALGALLVAGVLLAPVLDEPVSTAQDDGAGADERTRPPRVAPGRGIGLSEPGELADARAGGFEPALVGAWHWFTRGQSPRDVAWTADRAAELARAAPDVPLLVHYWWWAEESTYACMALEQCGPTRAEWLSRASLVGAELARALPHDARVIIVLETELNDARLFDDEGAQWVERELPALMADAAARLRAPLGDRATVTLSLGAYGFGDYDRLSTLLAHPQFAFVGFQTHANRDPDAPCGGDEDYARVFEERTLQAARALRALTPKPLGLWDAFIASDGTDGDVQQARYWLAVNAHAATLADLDVRWIVARHLTDWPDAPPGCLGDGERHLGFRTADEQWKPAWAAWVAGASAPPLPAGPAARPLDPAPTRVVDAAGAAVALP